MAKARSRAQARKIKDKWKSKRWYTMLAPPMFNRVPLAETVADDAAKLPGRVVVTTLQDLTGDFKQMHVKLRFQISEVTGTEAQTQFAGHALTSDYVRRMVRRNHSKISGTFDLQTKDGAYVRLKPFAVTDRRCQSSQQTLIRATMESTLREMATSNSLAGLMREILEGRASSNVYKACKKIYPLRRVEVGKTEVRAAPSIVVQDDVLAYGSLDENVADDDQKETPSDNDSEDTAASDDESSTDDDSEAASGGDDESPSDEEPATDASADATTEEATDESDAAADPEPPAQA